MTDYDHQAPIFREAPPPIPAMPNNRASPAPADRELSSKQEEIREREIKHARQNTIMFLLGLSTLLVYVQLLVFYMPDPTLLAVAFAGLAIVGVVALWTLAREPLLRRSIKKRQTATTCRACKAPFAVVHEEPVERLIASIPRVKQWTEFVHQPGTEINSAQVPVIRTRDWIEESYEIATASQCVVCGDRKGKTNIDRRNRW